MKTIKAGEDVFRPTFQSGDLRVQFWQRCVAERDQIRVAQRMCGVSEFVVWCLSGNRDRLTQ